MRFSNRSGSHWFSFFQNNKIWRLGICFREMIHGSKLRGVFILRSSNAVKKIRDCLVIQLMEGFHIQELETCCQVKLKQ